MGAGWGGNRAYSTLLLAGQYTPLGIHHHAYTSRRGLLSGVHGWPRAVADTVSAGMN